MLFKPVGLFHRYVYGCCVPEPVGVPPKIAVSKEQAKIVAARQPDPRVAAAILAYPI